MEQLAKEQTSDMVAIHDGQESWHKDLTGWSLYGAEICLVCGQWHMYTRSG